MIANPLDLSMAGPLGNALWPFLHRLESLGEWVSDEHELAFLAFHDVKSTIALDPCNRSLCSAASRIDEISPAPPLSTDFLQELRIQILILT